MSSIGPSGPQQPTLPVKFTIGIKRDGSHWRWWIERNGVTIDNGETYSKRGARSVAKFRVNQEVLALYTVEMIERIHEGAR